MKYLSMICRGHVPEYNGHVNKDAREFLRYFLQKGTKPNMAALQAAARNLHLAFKTMSTGEIYDVLMEQFLTAAAKYDPKYTDKDKEVVEVIENALSRTAQFRARDVSRHLEYDSHRYLRLLCRRGFLVAKRDEKDKRANYQRSKIWPPPAEFREPNP